MCGLSEVYIFQPICVRSYTMWEIWRYQNWKWKFCRQELTFYTQLRNRSFHVVDTDEDDCEMYRNDKKARTFLNLQIFVTIYLRN